MVEQSLLSKMLSQQWRFDLADVEPNWEVNLAARQQDVFVTIVVDRLIGKERVGCV